MGVSIEVYRSRIGSHHNFIHCCNRLHCLKGKLWNKILLMFYLNTFYFPYLKSQLKEEKGNREICQWYVQMVCTNGMLSCCLWTIITWTFTVADPG